MGVTVLIFSSHNMDGYYGNNTTCEVRFSLGLL